MGKFHLLRGIYEQHYKCIQEQQNKKQRTGQPKNTQSNCIRETNKWKHIWNINIYMQHMKSCIYRTNWWNDDYKI